MELKGIKYIVVGCGFWGSVIAERIASVLNEKVVVIDKRNHIGGNSYSAIDEETGIECHLYGTHIFHTKSDRVWKYINNFTEFTNYQHKVLTQYCDRVYSMPINLGTINSYYNINLKPHEVADFIEDERKRSGISNPRNLEEKAISFIGKPLYEAFIKGYTIKQWETDPKELPESIINRLPVRYNYNANYFNDPHQGLPKDGYFKLFENLLNNRNIMVKYNTDYYDIKNFIPNDAMIIFSGAVDRFFDYKHGRLSWRTLSFEKELHGIEDYQGTAVMNYANIEIPYTRIHEFKHLHPERNCFKNTKTVIYKEYSRMADAKDDPYYPINTAENNKIYAKYKSEINKLKNVIIGGRLGSYRYWDMDNAIEDALVTFDEKIARGNK